MSKALRIPGTRRSRRPLAGLGVLAALGLLFWLGVSLFLGAGWQTIAPTLTDEIGEASQLEGFTLSGQIAWNRIYDRMHFTLEDGVLRSQLTLDDPDAAAMEATYLRFFTNRSYVVPPEQRETANEKATVSGSDSDGELYISVPVDTVCGMYTISLPDGTALRLRAGNMTLPTPDTAWATLGKTPQRELDYAYDYTWNSGTVEMETSWPWTPLSGDGFALGAGYGLCWAQDYLGRAPGLYRAHGLTAEEIAALPRDGMVYDKEVLCGSTEFGSLEPFYCPEDAAEALAGVSMADGSTLLLYRTAEGTLCADLVNAAGIATDHRELLTLEDWESSSSLELMPRTDDGQATLSWYAHTQGGGGGRYLALLRAEDGTFTLARCVEDKDHLDPHAVVMNPAGDKILLAYGGSVRTPYGSNTQYLSDRRRYIQLRVYELDTGRMTYMGHINTGADRDRTGMSGLQSAPQSRIIIYDTLQKDGGLLP